eukprot:scaffold251801_cov30-Tisochrysis_lutea.AAC.1
MQLPPSSAAVGVVAADAELRQAVTRRLKIGGCSLQSLPRLDTAAGRSRRPALTTALCHPCASRFVKWCAARSPWTQIALAVCRGLHRPSRPRRAVGEKRCHGLHPHTQGHILRTGKLSSILACVAQPVGR